jgi:hypothetical protein
MMIRSLGVQLLSDPHELQQWQATMDILNAGTPAFKEKCNTNIPSASLTVHSGVSRTDIIHIDDDVIVLSDNE